MAKRILTEEQRLKKNENQRRWVENNREKFNENRRKHYHENKKNRTPDEIAKSIEYQGDYYKKNKVDLIKQSKKHYEMNKERINRRDRERKKEKPDYYKFIQDSWKKENPKLFKLNSNAFSLLRDCICGRISESPTLEENYGYTAQELREWAESQLPTGIEIMIYGRTHRLRLKKKAKSFGFEERGDQLFRDCFSFENMYFSENVIKDD